MSIIITDPSLLMTGNLDTATTPGSELTIDTLNRTIAVNPGFGDISDPADGVTFQALFSAFKLLWKNSPIYLKMPFPFESITPEQFEVINGWTFLNTITRKAIRTAGWAEKNASGVITAMYSGIISLGSVGVTDQPYFQQVNNGNQVNFSFTNTVNEAVQVYSDPTGVGNTLAGFDYRSYFKLFVREPQKVYAQAQLSDIGVTTMTYIAYRFPLANSTDSNVLVNDAGILANTITYGGINVTYHASNQERVIGGISYNYRIIIDGKGMTAEQVYTKIQYLLRQNSDIDSGTGTVIGKRADALLTIVGGKLISSTGVYVDNYAVNDTNRVVFTDILGVGRSFPYVATGALVFNTNLVNDPNAIYRMYFTTNPGGNYGTVDAIIVKDSNGIDIAGSVTSSTIPFTFSYDSNIQGGRLTGVDVEITVVAIGLTTAQYVSTTTILTRGVGQNIALTAPLERNYINL